MYSIHLLALSSLLLGGISQAADVEPAVQWIWASPARRAGQRVALRGEITVRDGLKRADLYAVADFCHGHFFVGQTRVAVREPYGKSVGVDVTELLKREKGRVGVLCQSVDGPAAVTFRLELKYADGKRETFVSDRAWRAATFDPSAGFDWPKAAEKDWRPVTTFGPARGYLTEATSAGISIGPLDDYTQWKQALDSKSGTDPATFQLPAGFGVTLIRSARSNEDSWVSLACDSRGRSVIGMEKKGLLRVTLPKSDDGTVKVETINDSLAECRGLLFAYDSLYAMANNDKSLFRLRDTNGDEKYDSVVRLATFEGSVGHGRNQLALGPDGMIYGIFGDAVFEPKEARRLPTPLTRPNHYERERSGFVARTDKNGREWEVIVRGLRNPFGIDFNQHGEIFTYDADAEYDTGASWYRPTRVNHLLPGGDFGWRRVTKQWPPYFPDRPDMPQPMLDTGKGSPTAVRFGTRSRFPLRYKRSLFALDWAYGRILALHMTPRGSSYAARAETFLRGQPLNVTGIDFGPDGAMYFVTGGRGTQSALYRVEYTGQEARTPPLTIQQRARSRHAEQSRRTRRRLESLFGKQEKAAIDTAWPHLSNSDPWVRHAARTVIESQPAGWWRTRALGKGDPDTTLAALTALLRVGTDADRTAIFKRLNQLPLRRLTERQKLEAIFLYDRSLAEDSTLASARRKKILGQLDPLYPDESRAVNRRLGLLLSSFEPADFVERTIELLERAETQPSRLHYLFVLRHAKTGWSAELRDVYFGYLRRTKDFIGGEGMPEFRRLIRTEALAALPSAERPKYEKLLQQEAEPWQAEIAAAAKRKFVRKWTVDELDDVLARLKPGSDVRRGRDLFSAARCIVCHRVGRRGGVSGPDLNSVSRRLGPRDLLTAIIEPSKVVSDKYQNNAFVLKDGRVIVGRIVPGDYRSPSLAVVPDLLLPEKVVTVLKTDVELNRRSPVSPMPAELLNTLTKDEVLDLLAYLIAPGDWERSHSTP